MWTERKGTGASLQSATGLLSSRPNIHRILEWFGLEGTFKIILFKPPGSALLCQSQLFLQHWQPVTACLTDSLSVTGRQSLASGRQREKWGFWQHPRVFLLVAGATFPPACCRTEYLLGSEWCWPCILHGSHQNCCPLMFLCFQITNYDSANRSVIDWAVKLDGWGGACWHTYFFITVRVYDYTGFLLMFRNLLMFLASGLFTFVPSVFCHLPLGGVHQQDSGGKRACSLALLLAVQLSTLDNSSCKEKWKKKLFSALLQFCLVTSCKKTPLHSSAESCGPLKYANCYHSTWNTPVILVKGGVLKSIMTDTVAL